MKRSHLIDIPHSINDAEFIRRVAFHEAGHAAAIYIRNKQKQLPPIFFQIYINHAYQWRKDAYNIYEYEKGYLTQIEDGRLIHTLPSSVAKAVADLSPKQEYEYEIAFEADIVNLLAGPLSEANYLALKNNKPINPNLVNLDLLYYYGGSSDLETINDYIDCLELTSTQRQAKLRALFLKALSFIKDLENWCAISTLAEYIISSKKNIIAYEDITSVLAIL